MTPTSLGLSDPSLLKDKCYIDGRWVGGEATIDVTNPVDDSVIGGVPKLGAGETRGARSRRRRRRRRPGRERPPRSARRSCANGST